MARILALCLAVAGLPFTGWAATDANATDDPAPAEELRIVSWNLRWFPGGWPKPRPGQAEAQMSAAQEALKGLEPDLLLLQEVRDEAAVKELCSVVPGLDVVVVSRFPQGDADLPQQNLAIASRLPVIAAWAERWQPADDMPPRGFVFALLEGPHRPVLAYSVHFKSNRGGEEDGNRGNIAKREEAARQLIAHLARVSANIDAGTNPVRAVVGGDFNTSLTDPRFRYEQTLWTFLRAGFAWTFAGTPPALRITLPAPPNGRFPDATFDHVFLEGWEGWTVTARAVDVKRVSDHMPVVVDLAGESPPVSPADTGGVENR